MNTYPSSETIRAPLRINESKGKYVVDFGPHPIWFNRPYSAKNVRYFKNGRVVEEIPEINYDLVPKSRIPECQMITEEILWLPYDEKSYTEVRGIDCVSTAEADNQRYIVLRISDPETFSDSEEWNKFKKMLDGRMQNRLNSLGRKSSEID